MADHMAEGLGLYGGTTAEPQPTAPAVAPAASATAGAASSPEPADA
jgi:hypothetical protein